MGDDDGDDDNGDDGGGVEIDLSGVIAGLQHIFGAMQVVDWSAFGRLMWDSDLISLEDTGQGADHLTLTLRAGAGITWWKDIEVYDSTGALRAAAWTQDSHTSASLSLPNDVADESVLVFKKAKFLGAHTAAYLVRDLRSRRGHSITFTWERDG